MRTSRRGFTLLEIMVVVLILAILAAAFGIGATAVARRGDQVAARAAAERVIAAQQGFASSWGTYTPDPDDLDVSSRDHTVITGEVTEAQTVSIAVGEHVDNLTGGSLVTATLGPAGSCVAVWVGPLASGTDPTVVSDEDLADAGSCDPAAILVAVTGETPMVVASQRY